MLKALLVLCLCVCVAFGARGTRLKTKSQSASLSTSASRSMYSRTLKLNAASSLESSSVKILNDDNFYSTVQGPTEFAVILFYATWSARSNKFTPEFVATAESFAGKNVTFAAVSAPDHKDIVTAFKCTGFPHVAMVTRGRIGENQLNFFPGGDYTQRQLTEFVDKIMLHEKFKYLHEQQAKEVEKTKLRHPGLGKAVELTVDNFDNYTLSTQYATFVCFYAPWCSACSDMRPLLNRVAEYFSKDKTIIIAMVNGEESPKLMERYYFTAYPSMIFFPKARVSKRGMNYPMEREQYDIQAFINNNNQMSDHPEMPYIDHTTDLEELARQEKATGRDPESLLKREGIRNRQR